MTSSGDPADFAKLATKVVTDIKAKKIDTRTLNRPELATYKKYMGELAPLKVSTSSKAPVPVIDKLIVPVNPHKVKQSLDVAGLKGVTGFPATERILDEISRLRYRDFPNATFDLLRTFIEKSIKAYAESVGETIPAKRGMVTFDDTLAWLQGKIAASGDKGLVQAMQRLRSTRSYKNFQLTKEALDAANHNPHIFIAAEDVKELWDAIPGILKFYLKA